MLQHAISLVAILLVSLSLIGEARGVQTMYWSDRIADTVSRSELDATNIDVLFSGLGETRGIDIDLTHGYLYWADNGTNKIQRSRLDGSGVEDLVTTGLSFPAGVAVDPGNQKLYWADAFNGRIQQSNLDGTGVVDLITEVTGPYFITLDLIHEQIYWTDQGTDKIQRANLDGSGIEDLVVGLSTPRGLALDLVNDKIYFADRGTDLIQRANLDGSAVETLVTINAAGVDPAPHGVALDLARGHLYWVDNGTVKIQRANLDGSDVVDLLDATGGDLTKPWQIVLDLELAVCDFDRSGDCDATDLDLLTREIRTGSHKALFNLNPAVDDEVNDEDLRIWIHELAQVAIGDANFDGLVDGLDLESWQTNRFTSDIGWAAGDFNGDRVGDGSDFNLWNQQRQAAVDATLVPEPASWWLAIGWFASVVCGRVGRRPLP